jgi:hypothetical protein
MSARTWRRSDPRRLASYAASSRLRDLPHGGPAGLTARPASADLATLIAMSDTDEAVRLRLLRAIRDLEA